MLALLERLCDTESITVHMSFLEIIVMELLFASSPLRHDRFTFQVLSFFCPMGLPDEVESGDRPVKPQFVK